MPVSSDESLDSHCFAAVASQDLRSVLVHTIGKKERQPIVLRNLKTDACPWLCFHSVCSRTPSPVRLDARAVQTFKGPRGALDDEHCVQQQASVFSRGPRSTSDRRACRALGDRRCAPSASGLVSPNNFLPFWKWASIKIATRFLRQSSLLATSAFKKIFYGLKILLKNPLKITGHNKHIQNPEP